MISCRRAPNFGAIAGPIDHAIGCPAFLASLQRILPLKKKESRGGLVSSACALPGLRAEKDFFGGAAQVNFDELRAVGHNSSSTELLIAIPECRRNLDHALASLEYGFVALHFDFVRTRLQLSASDGHWFFKLKAMAGRGARQSQCKCSKTECQFHGSHVGKVRSLVIIYDRDWVMPAAVRAAAIVPVDSRVTSYFNANTKIARMP